MRRVLFAVLMLFTASGIFAGSEYVLQGFLFNSDNSTGDAATANSYADFYAYRTGIAGQIGRQNNSAGSDGTVFDAAGGLPAYALTDVGSSDWVTPPAAGQTVRAVYEVQASANGWQGDSYFAVTDKTISASDIINAETALENAVLVKVDAPSIIQEGDTFITVGWTGADIDHVAGYVLYRKEEPAGNYTQLTITAQERGNPISYTDEFGMNITSAYTYKLALLFEWGGGSGAADTYETEAKTSSSVPAGTESPPAPKVTPVPHELANNLAKEKVIVFNNPIRDNRLKVGFDSPGEGTAYIYIYNLSGEASRRIVIPAVKGANIYEDVVNMLSPGIYISKIILQIDSDTLKLPPRKIAIIR